LVQLQPKPKTNHAQTRQPRHSGSVSNEQDQHATRPLADGLAATIPPMWRVLVLRDKQERLPTHRVEPSRSNLRAATLIASGTVKNWGIRRMPPSNTAIVGPACGKAAACCPSPNLVCRSNPTRCLRTGAGLRTGQGYKGVCAPFRGIADMARPGCDFAF